MQRQILTRRERVDVVRAGLRTYRALLPKLIEQHKGERIVIAVPSGDFVVSPSDTEFKKFANERPQDDLIWMATIGSI